MKNVQLDDLLRTAIISLLRNKLEIDENMLSVSMQLQLK